MASMIKGNPSLKVLSKSLSLTSGRALSGSLSLTHAFYSKYSSTVTIRVLVICGFLVYMAGVVALYRQFGDQMIWLAFLLVINVACLLIIGNYMLRSILFPYSNFFIKKQLDSVINRRFS